MPRISWGKPVFGVLRVQGKAAAFYTHTGRQLEGGVDKSGVYASFLRVVITRLFHYFYKYFISVEGWVLTAFHKPNNKLLSNLNNSY